MNKQERVMAALAGQEVDRIPYSLWYHFGNQHQPGEQIAETQLSFFERYDFDFMKIMNDYPYPFPEGLDRIRGLEDWKRITAAPLDYHWFQEQLKALGIYARRLEKKAYFVETVFNPIGVARRTAKDVIFTLMRNHPEEFKAGLEAITESFMAYGAAAIEAGAAGIFFSVNGATDDFMSRDEFMEFVKPYDMKMLKFFKEKAAFNIAHIHGFNLRMDDVWDYPVDAFNWSHLHSAPSLKEARAMTDVCLIGGIDEQKTSYFHPNDLETQIENAVAEAGTRKFMVGPGCAIPSDISPHSLDVVKRAVHRIQV